MDRVDIVETIVNHYVAFFYRCDIYALGLLCWLDFPFFATSFASLQDIGVLRVCIYSLYPLFSPDGPSILVMAMFHGSARTMVRVHRPPSLFCK